MVIDKRSPVPAYYQLKNYIIDSISSGQWKKDNPIPSERELAMFAKVSRMTVRQAINELVNEGILYRVKGKGTFITRTKIEQKNIMSFSEMVKSKGMVPNTQILEFNSERSYPDIAELMGLQLQTEFYRFKRLRKAGDIPVAIEEVYIPAEYCRNIQKYDLTGSLYGILHEHYQFRIGRMDVSIEAILPDVEQQKLLLVGADVPLLKVYGNTIADTGIELFHEISYYRSDKLSFKVSIFDRKI